MRIGGCNDLPHLSSVHRSRSPALRRSWRAHGPSLGPGQGQVLPEVGASAGEGMSVLNTWLQEEGGPIVYNLSYTNSNFFLSFHKDGASTELDIVV